MSDLGFRIYAFVKTLMISFIIKVLWTIRLFTLSLEKYIRVLLEIERPFSLDSVWGGCLIVYRRMPMILRQDIVHTGSGFQQRESIHNQLKVYHKNR